MKSGRSIPLRILLQRLTKFFNNKLVLTFARIIMAPPRPNCALRESFSHPQHMSSV